MRAIYNQGDQRISVVPIHPVTGAPVVVDSGSDVTVSIVDLRWHDQATQHTVLASTTVTQDAFSAALTGSAGYSQASPHTIPVDASAAALGRTYLLEDATGQREAVQLRSINGTTSAFSVHRLRRNYVATDTLRGVELVATFPSAEANDEDSVEDAGGPYLATWTYVVDGQTVVLPTELWVDRYSLTPPIDDAWVLMGQPTMANRAREDVSPAIAVSWQDWLAKLESRGEDPSLFPPSHTVKVALRKLALSYLNQWASGGDADNDLARELKSEATDLFNDVLTGNVPRDQVKLTRDDVSHVTKPVVDLFSLT